MIAQRVGHPFVNLVPDLTAHAQRDLADGFLGVRGRMQERVEEQHGFVDASGLARDRVESQHVHGFGQHGVTKAVHGMRELRRDRCVQRDVVARKGIDVRGELTHELPKDHVLVFHLGDQLGGLEEHLVGPGGSIGSRLPDPALAVRTAKNHGLDVDQHPVVLRVEHVVNGGETEVLVDATVTRDKVLVYQVRDRSGVSDRAILVVLGHGEGGKNVAKRVGISRVRTGAVGHVIKERMPNARQGERGQQRRDVNGSNGGHCACFLVKYQHRRVRRDVAVLDVVGDAGCVFRDEPHVAVSVESGRAVCVQAHLGYVVDVDVMQRNADPRGVLLDIPPRGHASGGTTQRIYAVAADKPPSDRAGWVVLAQKRGVTRGRAVGLAQVDEGRDGVHALAVHGVGARSHHEVERRARNIQRVAWEQWHEHRAVLALVHEVETVIEELPDQGHVAAV